LFVHPFNHYLTVSLYLLHRDTLTIHDSIYYTKKYISPVPIYCVAVRLQLCNSNQNPNPNMLPIEQ